MAMLQQQAMGRQLRTAAASAAAPRQCSGGQARVLLPLRCSAAAVTPVAAPLLPRRRPCCGRPGFGSSGSSGSSSVGGALRPPPQQRALLPAPCRSSGPNQQQPSTTTTSGGDDAGSEGGSSNIGAINAVLLAMWVGLLGYVFTLAPNQTPTIDAFTIQKLVGLKADDPFQVNGVFTAVWNFMGLYPLVYAAVLVPGARSARLPAWPFCSASVFLGMYALLPWMALWEPKRPNALPPPAEELGGWRQGFVRAAEAPWLPLGLCLAASYWLFRAATAGGDAWLQYLQLFDESRLVHGTTLDFALCTLLMPFWLGVDAEGRRWQGRALAPLLCALPVAGPALYLVLRPKAFGGSGDGGKDIAEGGSSSSS